MLGDWNAQRESLLFYDGPVWYRSKFSYHKRQGTRVFVHFGAANYRAVAYLNDEQLGEHEEVSLRLSLRSPQCGGRRGFRGRGSIGGVMAGSRETWIRWRFRELHPGLLGATGAPGAKRNQRWGAAEQGTGNPEGYGRDSRG